MEKMFYFSEREYYGKAKEKDVRILEYWNNLLGKDNIELLKETYGVSLEDVLFGEYKVKEYPNKMLLNKIDKNFSCEKIERNEDSIEINRIVFYEFAEHFVKYGYTILKTKNLNSISAVVKCYLRNLTEKVIRISVSTLMFEMYLLKENGQLLGENPKEEYEDYCRRYLSNTEYVESLLNLYPCLKRMLIDMIENVSTNYSLLSERLIEDETLLSEKFNSGMDLGEVEEVRSSDSDSHKKGNCVFIIKWSGGKKIVYKPHSLKVEDSFQKFQEYISNQCKIRVKEFIIIDRGAYGWEEFVEHKACKSDEEIKRYYYRTGMLIFCTYLLNVNDIHTENLIAVGEYPVIIDSETILVNNREKKKRSAIEKVNDLINESVLNSGILPLYKYAKKGKGIDMSATNGKEGDVYPILVPALQDVGLSTMHYEYRYPTRKKSGNYVSLNGEMMAPGRYVAYICEGFEDAYRYALKDKGKIYTFINIFKNLNVRHIVQDTQRYSMLLHTSYNPDFLQDARDRQLFLCNILKNVKEIQGSLEVAKLEIKDMLNMDVPYFYSNTNEKNLYGSEGERVVDYFAETSFEHLRTKVENLCEIDLERQIKYIKIILTNLNDLKVEKIKNNMPSLHKCRIFGSEYDIKLKAIMKLLDVLEKEAVYGDNNEDVNWMGVKPIGEKGNSYWKIRPLGVYLYDGIGGIAIFYHALSQYLCDKRLKKKCEAFDNTLFRYTKDMLEQNSGLENESSGAFAGEASMVYIYELLYSITNKKEYLKYAINHAEILRKPIECDQGNDIIYGNAGAIIVLIHLFHLTKDIKYLEWANIAGKNLIKNQHEGGWYNKEESEILTGFSHGIAGIIFALTILNTENNKREYCKAISEGLFCENTMYIDKYQNWLDNRKEAQKQVDTEGKFMAAWCHGAPGILLGRSKMYDLLPDGLEIKTLVIRDANRALKSTEKYGFSNNDCICHGNLGNTEILLEYARVFKENDLEKRCRELRTQIAFDIINDTYDCARQYLYGYKIPGFMTGVSGMAYSLLRDIYPSLPCVLSLEI